MNEKRIEFSDFMDLENLVVELNDVNKLLSILGENVFYSNEKLSPYAQQFEAVNIAAQNSVKSISKQIESIFCTLHKKIKPSADTDGKKDDKE